MFLLLKVHHFANLVRFPPMFENVGIAASSGITTALMVCISAIPTILLHWRGRVWRVGNDNVDSNVEVA